jgi:DNA-binding transcriptional ArsR family regulator
MVEYGIDLNAVFHSLADPTRRDILRRVMRQELSINHVAHTYSKHMSLAAVSKQQFIAPSPPAFLSAAEYLETYRELWEKRLDNLEVFLETNK